MLARRDVSGDNLHTKTGWAAPKGGRRPSAVALVGAVVGGLALAGCGPTITAPDVVGMRLDAAHQAFEKLEVTEFEDKDGIEDRSIFLDNGWVVLKQKPAAGTKDVGTGTTIELTVAKVGDKQIRDLLPADAPVIVELEKAEAAEERQQLEEAEAEAKAKADAAAEAAKEKAASATSDREDARGYTSVVGPIVEEFNSNLGRYDQTAAAVRAGGGNEVTAGQALSAVEYYKIGRDGIANLAPPSGLEGVNDDLARAMGLMLRASKALVVAIDTGAPSALAEERQARDEGRNLWAKTVRRIYTAADQQPPLPPR